MSLSGFEDYGETLLDHFDNPRNVGEIARPDAAASVRSEVHGDSVKFTMRIVGGRILEARFRALGCPVTIAAASVATEMLRGKSVSEALALRDEDVARALGGLPVEKLHCSVLIEQALRQALSHRVGTDLP